MKPRGTVYLEWADDTYPFRIAVREHREIKRITQKGPVALYRILASGDWDVDQIRAILHQGLIGGGMEVKKANDLIRRYFDEIEQPLRIHVEVADLAMRPSLFGSDDTEKKAQAAEEPKKKQPSPQSSDTPGPSVSQSVN